MATSNKSKKILEKARKVAAKTKKKKVSKVEKTGVKKKTTFYPEGQNAPQSKRYTQESDKTLSAKATGWRWTKEGAKKVGKPVESKPTTSDIEKYRNETFKLKGKPNKSGPKGVGDGSHRYLYVERRADKADITRKNKLAKGGAIWVEIRDDFEEDGVTYIDAFTTSDDNEEGKVIAKVKSNGEVIYLDDRAKTDSLAQEVINDVKKRKKEDGGKMAKGGGVEDLRKRFEGYTDEELQIFNGDNKETLKNWNRKDAIEDAINSVLDEDDGGEMAKGGKIPSDEVAEFKNYVKDYYGEGGIFSEFFPPVGVSSKEVNLAVNQYIDYCKTKDDQWGGGDTFDREIVRDIMLYNRGTKKGLEYQRAIKEIFGKDKKEYGGILQPMIGGVNADPRFDIYNTTMFAEKGAELAKGGGVKYSLDYFKMKLHELDPWGNIYINYDEDDNQWYWEDYQNDTYRDGFKSEKDAYDDAIGYLDSLGGDVEYAKGGTTFGEFGSGRLNKNAWISANYIGDSKVKLGDLQSYLERNTNEDFDKNKIYTITRTLFKSGDYEIDDNKDWKLSTIYRKRKMAKGGSTHEQGYDDREDESLAMRHGKIARKHFVGSHKRKEHSRRDDAHFETRHKKAYGGLTDSSIELLD
jgi:hypothetical protein